MSESQTSLMNLEKDKPPGLSGSVLECGRDGAGSWGQVLESRQGGSWGACLGSWTFWRATGSPEGQQRQVSILGRGLQGKKQDCGLNPGPGQEARGEVGGSETH